MCTKGVWHLNKITIRYCPMGGSSFGTREFIRGHLPAWATANGHVQVMVFPKRNKHPVLEGQYIGNKVPRVVDLRNKTPREIAVQLAWLRANDGSKVGRFGKPVYTSMPSIQGPWSADSNVKDIEVKVNVIGVVENKA